MAQQQQQNILHNDNKECISLICDDNDLGIISTDGKVYIIIENFALCGETWGFKIDDKEITDIKNLPEYNTIKITMHNGVTTGDRGEIHLTMTCDDTDYNVVIWCEHNGYYSHDVRMSWPGHESTEQL